MNYFNTQLLVALQVQFINLSLSFGHIIVIS